MKVVVSMLRNSSIRSQNTSLKTSTTQQMAYCCIVGTHYFFVVVVFFLFFLAFLSVLYVSHKLNFIMLSSRLSYDQTWEEYNFLLFLFVYNWTR